MIKIKRVFKSVSSVMLIISLSVFISACATSNIKKAEHNMKMMNHDQSSNKMNHDQHNAHSSFYGKRENAVTQLSENKRYKVSLFCNDSPIPMGIIHDWTVHIETPEGKPVENAKVFVFGGMPMHKHDFPTVPKVKEYLGNGDYRVEGLKFSMIGHWEMRFTIEKDRKRDRVKFKIHM